jgi:acetylornithine/succinyldiaminopimelate/putrescine aminotransferase
LHGTTFGGGPLTCAAALAFLRSVEEENLLANVRARGAEILTGLERLKSKFDFITQIRGEGLIVGIELNMEGAPIVEAALAQGLLINCTHERTLRFLPAFTITSQHVREFLGILESVFEEIARAKAEPQAAAASNVSR